MWKKIFDTISDITYSDIFDKIQLAIYSVNQVKKAWANAKKRYLLYRSSSVSTIPLDNSSPWVP